MENNLTQHLTQKFKQHQRLIFALGFAYGATIVFPAFGPALKASAGQDMLLMSTVAFLCYTVSFMFPQDPEKTGADFIKIALISYGLISPAVLFFDKLPNIGQWGILILFSLFSGQLGGFWTQYFRLMVDTENRGQVTSMSICLTFFILYVGTIVIDYTPVRIALAIPLLLIFLSLKSFTALHTEFDERKPPAATVNSSINPNVLYFLLVVIYISGGFTYAGIFPKFESYTFIAKYYNVQPLFLTVLFAGLFADLIGRRKMLFIGFGMVGLSFTTFLLPASYASYFLTQTFTQMGWGFINTFVWTISADISNRNHNRYIAARGVACMLLGTVLGASIAYVFSQSHLIHNAFYGAVTLIPIFIGIITIVFIPETLELADFSTKETHISQFSFLHDLGLSDNDVAQDPVLEKLSLLTNREKEIALLLIEGHTRSKICETLNISINTLKTHIRNIYRKLDISSKEELKDLIS